MRGPTECIQSEPLFDSGLIKREQFHFPPELQSGEYFFTFAQRGSSKIPCSPNSLEPHHINGFEPGEENLVTYDKAVSVAHRSREKYPPDKALSGVMIATGSVEDLVVIDLDDVIDVETAYMDPLLREFLTELDDTFWELSMSGTGAHGYVLDSEGVVPDVKKNGTIETIDSKGVALTGQHVQGTSKTVVRCDGIIGEYQAIHNERRSVTPSTGAGGKSDVDPSPDRETVPLAREHGLDEEAFWDAWGRTEDDLNKRERQVVNAMCEHNPKGKQLWTEGHNAELAVDDKSRNDMALMGRLVWWGREADMFDFELSQAEVERLFLASPLGKRDQSKRPDKVSLTAYKAIWCDPG